MLGHADSFDPWIADLDALVADWRRETAGPYVLIGHSTGGNLVLRHLMERPGDADAAVLISPLIGLRVPLLPDAVVAWVARRHVRRGQGGAFAWGQAVVEQGAARAAALTSDPDRYADEGWWWEQTPGLKLGGVSWGWLAAAFESIGRLMRPGGVERVTTPVLLLAATHDRVVSTRAIHRLLARLPDARGRFFPHAAHELLRERDDARMSAFAAIDAFLDEKAPL
jgi:lysophospholipase